VGRQKVYRTASSGRTLYTASSDPPPYVARGRCIYYAWSRFPFFTREVDGTVRCQPRLQIIDRGSTNARGEPSEPHTPSARWPLQSIGCHALSGSATALTLTAVASRLPLLALLFLLWLLRCSGFGAGVGCQSIDSAHSSAHSSRMHPPKIIASRYRPNDERSTPATTRRKRTAGWGGGRG
jgi:hypothetical protein